MLKLPISSCLMLIPNQLLNNMKTYLTAGPLVESQIARFIQITI